MNRNNPNSLNPSDSSKTQKSNYISIDKNVKDYKSIEMESFTKSSMSKQSNLLKRILNNQLSYQEKIDDTKLDNVVINSNLRDDNPVTQAKNVLEAFNYNVVPDQGAFST